MAEKNKKILAEKKPVASGWLEQKRIFSRWNSVKIVEDEDEEGRKMKMKKISR